LYFAAADLVILPYRTFMSSSGPLSVAFSYGKPFIVSKNLSSYFDSSDFRLALKEVGLKRDTLVFSLRSDSLAKKVQAMSNHHTLQKAASLAQIMAERRNWETLAAEYNQAVKAPKIEVLTRFRLNFLRNLP